MAELTTGTCADCPAWDITDNPALGLCRYYPPVVVSQTLPPSSTGLRIFPRTAPTDWCYAGRSLIAGNNYVG